MLTLQAFAKLNLTLDIVGCRADGYHLLDSVMQSVSLYDTVFMEATQKTEILCDNAAVNNRENICYKALSAFSAATGSDCCAKIKIIKRIPLAAGLGGGSADAAAVLMGLNSLYHTNLSVEKLCEIGLTIGADVPFCLRGGTARVQGIGEKIKPLPAMRQCCLVAVKDGEKPSTAQMYAAWDNGERHSSLNTEMFAAALQAGEQLRILAKSVGNDFECVQNHDEIFRLLRQLGAAAVSLSGSGPTVFGLFDSLQAAKGAESALQRNGIGAMLLLPVQTGILIE